MNAITPLQPASLRRVTKFGDYIVILESDEQKLTARNIELLSIKTALKTEGLL